MYPSILAILAWFPGTAELIVIGVLGLLIFGRRLPDVARSVGKSIVEFKRGMRDVKDDIDLASRIESKPSGSLESPSPKPPTPTEDAGGASTPAGKDQS